MNTISGAAARSATGDFAGAMQISARETSARALNLSTIRTLRRFTYGLVPVVAGIDKFTGLLANWDAYLNPLALKILPIGAHAFMEIVGVVEIAAGLLTLLRPRLGAYVVMAWLVGIALNLITGGGYYDVAVRDLVMAIGAFTLANLYAQPAGVREGRAS